MFRLAAKYHASCHVHLRGGSTGSTAEPEAGLEEVLAAAAVTGLEEVLAAAAVTGAPLQLRRSPRLTQRYSPKVSQAICFAVAAETARDDDDESSRCQRLGRDH